MASPSGVPPIPDISSRLMTPSIVFSFVTPLFVALRVASRVRFTKRLGRDDWTIVISCVFSVILSITMIVATVFQCTPTHRAWDRNVAGTCINLLTVSWYANAAFSILSDLAILIIAYAGYKISTNAQEG
ncbi:integral membrane protein [Histoplasma capsulatum G186AR]|uniref:Integral membrane protein n=1 Tax=Ajellomyces capsulatus (strain G186AR / H82 / ATCC MYA-2454 / RMSCC 2432) TaxID=447093 RepID=C0NW55_AJECG|nr:uncharacterized protein HCBG_07385 [Histoplasma capsulatum G186AR]EEH04160.1 integral membrane protein [Histoplasma capsulatum G186AR]